MRLGREQIHWHKGKSPRIHLLHNLHILDGILLLLGQGILPAPIICEQKLQLFPPLAHQLIAEGGGADAEKGRIIGQRVKNLEIGNAPCHHDIGRRVSLGEHILDLGAGPHIPVRHAMV